MDIYLKQQQQMNSQIIPENQISMQNINYTPMLKQNNNNYESSSQLQTIPQQIPQSTIMYPLNSVKANPNAFNMLQIEQQQGINDSDQHQTPSTLFPGNTTELSSLTNNILSNDSQENAKKNTISISPSSDSILENQSENNSQDTKSETTNNSEIKQRKQNQLANYTLQEIKGIIPNAGPDQQHVFVCRFSDSVSDEYVPNKQMRKRYALQLIKFYESHMEPNVPRPDGSKAENTDNT